MVLNIGNMVHIILCIKVNGPNKKGPNSELAVDL